MLELKSHILPRSIYVQIELFSAGDAGPEKSEFYSPAGIKVDDLHDVSLMFDDTRDFGQNCFNRLTGMVGECNKRWNLWKL